VKSWSRNPGQSSPSSFEGDVLGHQLRQDFILALDLSLQVLDTLLLGLVVGAACGLKGGGAVFG
jgi:hypothetical protein